LQKYSVAILIRVFNEIESGYKRVFKNARTTESTG
jgi:hypothetical protein